MIEYRWGECYVAVADMAILARRHMHGGRIFAGRESTVVASFTATGDLPVTGVEKV